MSQLTVRCLGGFDVRLGERQITTFESNKVRALFAYLVSQRDRSLSRDHLAGLLWPEKPNEAARRNLRQALYNLKTVLADGSPIMARGNELRIDPQLDCWLDVDAFVEARRRGAASEAVVPHYLAGAVALYRGDFLAGFGLKDSPDFELWQLAEQERLHDLAVDTLRVLIESYLSRGEFRLGIQYARRLVAIDSLSEHAHRYLIRLYSLSGRRRRAIAAYERLRDILGRELGVEPLAETRLLYEQVLTDHAPELETADLEAEDRRGFGPLIPLVGRHEPYQQLNESWHSVLEGRCRLTVVGGEAGIGKTRLVKSFLDAVSSQRLTTILKGRCSEQVPTPYQPFAKIVESAFSEDSHRAHRALESEAANMAELAELAALAPEIRELLPGAPAPEQRARAQRARLFESIASFLKEQCRANDGSSEEPLVLMLADLQWARPETCELLEFLLERLATSPVWILGTCCLESRDPSPLIVQRLADWRASAETAREGSSVSRIALERLAPEAVEEITATLVGNDQAGELASFLNLHGEGLPLVIAEWINCLWDERLLTYDAGQWRLQKSLAGLSGDLEQLVRRRLQRLPTSTRRLASQAAVIGQTFDARLLAEAAEEHPRVVEVGLEWMLERWLIRQHDELWRSGRREHDIVLWAKGARLGNFEFNHRLIWRSILGEIDPSRRKVMHRDVATILEKHFARDAERYCETLAFHCTRAGEWRQAFTHLQRATAKALEVSATDTARHYGQQAVEVADRLRKAAGTAKAEARWRREREHAVAALEEIEALNAPGS